ncbi:hypothetical protein ACO2Q0_03070 [Phenylobacterium sp. VNQ135]|uniref:hypothetical protein n=1 Tax=Phenylobacterium sp. VNQ135 TaxID=3400922 RepID=UPI003C0EEB16
MKNDPPPADDPLNRPLDPIAPIPGVDVDVQAEANARIIGARIPRPHQPNSGWEQTRIVSEGAFSLGDPVNRAASRTWINISGAIGAAGIVSAMFYPVGIVRSGWIPMIWGMLALNILLLPVVERIDGYEYDDVWRRRAANALATAPLTAVLSWWGPMTTPAVFAAAFPVLFVMSILQFILALKRHVRPATRRRLIKAATIVWGLAGAAAVAKLVVMFHGGGVDQIPAIVPLAIALLCLAQAIRTAQAPQPAAAT